MCVHHGDCHELSPGTICSSCVRTADVYEKHLTSEMKLLRKF